MIPPTIPISHSHTGGGMVSFHGRGGSIHCGAAGSCMMSDSRENDPTEGADGCSVVL